MVFALCFFFLRHVPYSLRAIIRLSTYCKVYSHIQLVSCCEGFPAHLKERFLHFNNRIISLLGTDCMDQFVYFSYIFLDIKLVKLIKKPPVMKPTARGLWRKIFFLLVCVNYRKHSLEYSFLELRFIFQIKKFLRYWSKNAKDII